MLSDEREAVPRTVRGEAPAAASRESMGGKAPRGWFRDGLLTRRGLSRPVEDASGATGRPFARQG